MKEDKSLEELKSADLEHTPLKSNLEDIKIIQLKDKVIMNNKQLRSRMEQRNLSDTFSSLHPNSFMVNSPSFKFRAGTLGQGLELHNRSRDLLI